MTSTVPSATVTIDADSAGRTLPEVSEFADEIFVGKVLATSVSSAKVADIPQTTVEVSITLRLKNSARTEKSGAKRRIYTIGGVNDATKYEVRGQPDVVAKSNYLFFVKDSTVIPQGGVVKVKSKNDEVVNTVRSLVN